MRGVVREQVEAGENKEERREVEDREKGDGGAQLQRARVQRYRGDSEW